MIAELLAARRPSSEHCFHWQLWTSCWSGTDSAIVPRLSAYRSSLAATCSVDFVLSHVAICLCKGYMIYGLRPYFERTEALHSVAKIAAEIKKPRDVMEVELLPLKNGRSPMALALAKDHGESCSRWCFFIMCKSIRNTQNCSEICKNHATL